MSTAAKKPNADRSRVSVKPFLITTDADSQFRLTLRRTWYNSQNFPIVESELQPEIFSSMNAVRAFAREQFGAEVGQFARA